jgi:hypothetical protein
MKHGISLALYLCTALLLVQNQLLLAAVCAFWFSMRVNAVFLIPLAIVVDGYFGAFADIPYISFVATVWYLLSEYIKPKLLLYRKQYEEVA